MPPEFDRSQSDLQVGMEIEYPRSPGWDDETRFKSRGKKTSSMVADVSSTWPLPGIVKSDPTVGIEIESPVLDMVDAAGWYADAIEHVEEEHNAPHAPTGLVRGNTAGLHIHISPLSRQQAKRLYRISETSWAKAFFCTSIVTEDGRNDWPVFRCGSGASRYCRFSGFGNDHHYNVVNKCRGDGHYEWRLPEPMTARHLDHVMEFLTRFYEDEDRGIQYAQELLDEGSDDITSLKRAEYAGMDLMDSPRVARQPHEATPEFYEEVEAAPWFPQINLVRYEGDVHYLFDSRLSGEFEALGVRFDSNDVLFADTLESVGEDRAQEIRRAYENYGNQRNRTEATDLVEEIVKKKKAEA